MLRFTFVLSNAKEGKHHRVLEYVSALKKWPSVTNYRASGDRLLAN
jgi:hypothetical protein